MLSLDSGHVVTKFSAEEKAQQEKDFTTLAEVDLIRLQPGGWYSLSTFTDHANEIYKFKFKPTDVVLMTIPKSGTTWTQELIWNMRHNPNLEADKETANMLLLSPQIDLDFLFDNPCPTVKKLIEGWKKFLPEMESEFDMEGPLFRQLAERLEGPRTLKTHLPFSLLPKELLETCKIVYVVRNPKDVCISYHHHCKFLRLHGYVGSFDQFVDYFLNGSLMYLPYWPHLKEALTRRHHPNLHFIHYSSLKKDTMAEVQRLNTFLGTKLIDKQMHDIIQHCSFETMQKRQAESFANDPALSIAFDMQVFKEEGGLVRKGIVDGWKNKLSKEQDEKFDKWMQENMEGLDISF